MTTQTKVTDTRKVHIDRAGELTIGLEEIEIDADEQMFVCPECGELTDRSCANGHQAIAIVEHFSDVF
jgi:hypothetical protein